MITKKILIMAESLGCLGEVIALANAAEDTAIQFIGAANAYALDNDGWLTIPYGDTPHSGNDGLNVGRAGDPVAKPVIQRLTREDAVALTNDFHSGWSRFKRAIVGLPIFKGHPDAPRYAKKYPDKTPRGTIADMQVGETGLRIKPVLTEQGATDVEGGWNETSPFWALKVIGEEAGARIAAPFKLFSLGLVPQGNIQGLSLTNAAEPQIEHVSMNPLLIQLLAALGITLAANATEEDAKKAVDQALPKITAANTAVTELSELKLANSAEIEVCEDGKAKKIKVPAFVPTLQSKVTSLEGDVVRLTNEKNTLSTRATTAEESFKAERKARALLVVNSAVTAGRVAGNARDAEVVSLANAADFDAAATALASRAPVLKTTSNLHGLTTAAVESQDRQQQIVALVNSAMETPTVKNLPTAERYDAAFNQVRKDPKNAALWPAKV